MFEHFQKQTKDNWIKQANKETQKYESISFPYYFSLDELELLAINTERNSTVSNVNSFSHSGESSRVSIWLPNYTDKFDGSLFQEVVNRGVEDVVIELPASQRLTLTGIDSQIKSIAIVNSIAEFGDILDDLSNLKKSLPDISFYSNASHDPFFQSPTTKTNNEILVELICEDDFPIDARLLGIRGDGFTNLGASVVLELAAVLSQLAFYWDKITDRGLSLEKLMAHTEVMLGLGGEFYLDLAKFKAMRQLLHYFLDAYQVADPNPFNVRLRAVSGVFNKTLYDPDGNLLRNTTEALAASLGGADIISLRTHDLYYKSSSEFSRRMAVNIQHLINEESHLHQVVNPTEGSYFLDTATEQLVDKAWKLFLEIEKLGGITQYFSSREGVDLLNRSQEEKKRRVNKQHKVVVGVTKYVNPDQKVDISSVQTALLKNNLTADWERVRLELDQLERDKMKTITISVHDNNNAQVIARITYVTELLTALGLKYAINNRNFDIEPSTRTLGIFIICGSDEWYATNLEGVLGSKNLAEISVFAVGNTESLMQLYQKQLLTGVLKSNSDLTTFISTIDQKILHET